MDRIAVISDIHGNQPALLAVLQDIRQRGIGRIYCLGDLVGKGPSPDAAVDLVRGSCQVVVQGNWDDLVSRKSDAVLDWHRDRLGPDRLRYLEHLPYSHDFYMSGRKIRLFHASAKGLYHRVQPGHPLEERMAMFDHTELVDRGSSSGESSAPDVVGYGDVHNAFVQHLGRRMLFNAGSVGNPLDMNQAVYAVLEGNFGSLQPAPFGVQLVRVPYDIEGAIRQAEEADMPDLEPYARELRTARYRGLPPA
ncbi:metallophosphoesterase family protein [Gorillibacterium sp. sgz5001074]|uniref:metallophosphoesterase family protein n=1 Tax=Gorillibacterium sp. sgz5001074 TaxID=3446695 RepID=UPI003F672932